MVSTPTADFDPAAFQLPDLLKKVKGPEVKGLPVQAQVLFVEQQLKQEQAHPQSNPTIEKNLARQLKQSRESARDEKLKQILAALKNLRAADPAAPAYTQGLMQAIASLKACFADHDAPTDLDTMTILFPLLKCQELKWDALKSGLAIETPAPEAKLLQKWRCLKGSLSAIEKASVYQIILGLNALCQRRPLTTKPPVLVHAQTAAEPPQSQSSEPVLVEIALAELAPFDPITSGRQILQWRAKMQRSCSAAEKEVLQAQLNALLRQQSAYYVTRREQSLQQHQHKYAQVCQELQQPLTTAQIQQLRQQLVKQLEHLQRLFAQDKTQLNGPEIFVSAIRQLARLGLSDAEQVLAHEHQQQTKWVQSFAAQQQTGLKAWQDSYQRLLKALEVALSKLNQRSQQTQAAALASQIQLAQAQFKQQSQALAQWEHDWLQATDPAQQNALRQKMLQAYAQLILELPDSHF